MTRAWSVISWSQRCRSVILESGAGLHLPGDHQLDAGHWSGGGDDVSHVLVCSAGERDTIPLQHLVTRQQVTSQVCDAALLHLESI